MLLNYLYLVKILLNFMISVISFMIIKKMYKKYLNIATIIWGKRPPKHVGQKTPCFVSLQLTYYY